MELSKNFEHKDAELKWYKLWEEDGLFHSTPDDRPAYTIVMPPPNVTGVLHMGHALNNTVQDFLIRRAKMKGFNTCWVPGTDHASIATEAKVVAMLKEEGIDKNSLSRDEFLKHAWAWKEKYGGIILTQLRKLGCALDWDRTHFTMDEEYYAAVIHVFNDLYEKGLIYRDTKMINWDPQALTSLSDEEVIHKSSQSKLYYVKYKIDSDQEEYLTIATVRPETILGDTAICVHPDDARYKHLKGKHAFVPLINRRVPIIFDDYIDIEFGTGALKVTPAHDVNDYNLGKKHQLEVIDTLNADGTLSAAAGMYIGEDRFVVRKKIIKDIEAIGQLEKVEDYQNQVGYSERTNAVVEPRLSMQWWCNMKEMAKPALEVVMDEKIEFFPSKYKNLYRHWMENIKDWNISRQLWWGQRIPAWYDEKGNIYVAENAEQAFLKYKEKNGLPADVDLSQNILRQDEDCLDTWFSSWLWPMEVFGWNKDSNNEELNYYFPTNTLVTAPEIIFFWVARMIMAAQEYKKAIPFKQVYFTGVVRDKQGRKMSKQLGNSPDLLGLIDDFGADAVRFSVLISSPAGNDLLYDEATLNQGRNFINKMWNALKLIKSWEDRIGTEQAEDTTFARLWMTERIHEVSQQLETLIGEYKLSEGLKLIYSLIWDDFCSWYLEWIKPQQQNNITSETYEHALESFEKLVQLLHPFLPFITEEIFQNLKAKNKGEFLMAKPLPEFITPNSELLEEGQALKDLITGIREARNINNLKPKTPVELTFQTSRAAYLLRIKKILAKQVNAQSIKFEGYENAEGVQVVVDVDQIKLYSEALQNTNHQKEVLEKELAYLKGFLISVEKKLNNEKFMANAKPEVIAIEKKKQTDAIGRIGVIEKSLAG